MKVFFALSLAFCLSPVNPAFAGDVGQGQRQGQGQGQYQGERQRDIETYAGCREGERETFLEDVGSGSESMQPVQYVCEGGRFVKLYKDARDYGPRSRPIYSCREGSTEIFYEDAYNTGESSVPVYYDCRGGRFVKRYKDARDFGPRERRILSCREGSEETFLENTDSSGEGMRPVRYVCRGGRYIPINR